MVKVFSSSNPTQMYMDALVSLLAEGKKYYPRGKEILELRPVVFEYLNPINRVTCLKGRVINPFFQLAESWWILAGRADVEWLSRYNGSITQFSDDGTWFNAPYGERLRAWGENRARGLGSHLGVRHSGFDQLKDCYEKIKADLDTRQAVAFIGNPDFDNSAYTLKGGKDIACNLNIKFKVRDGKLHASVDNRSNDLHWGVFGANLCQFATIQETMASWLGIEVGTYTQVTDSLHVYTKDYGSAETSKILSAYGMDYNWDGNIPTPPTDHFAFITDPIMDITYAEFHELQYKFYANIDSTMHNPSTYNNESRWGLLMDYIDQVEDDYWRMAFCAMSAYQAHKSTARESYDAMLAFLESMVDCQWKVSCLRFLSKRYGDRSGFKLLYEHLDQEIIDYIDRKGE